ncbi:MAG: hypothetical protein K6B40_03875 [Firmicutes bacterium]|nr:hypothetical protein [Bacillota bacterium]
MEDRTELSEQELLAALVKGQRKSLRQARIASFFGLAITVLLLLTLLQMLFQVTTTLSRLDGTLSSMEDALGSLDSFIENADVLSDAAARMSEMDVDTLNNGIRDIGQIDFDKLNQAISDLADVVQPLARLANMFN